MYAWIGICDRVLVLSIERSYLCWIYLRDKLSVVTSISEPQSTGANLKDFGLVTIVLQKRAILLICNINEAICFFFSVNDEGLQVLLPTSWLNFVKSIRSYVLLSHSYGIDFRTSQPSDRSSALKGAHNWNLILYTEM